MLAVASALLALSQPAQAETKSLPDDAPSFYLYGSPAFIGVPMGEEDVTDSVDVSYQWGLGLGGLLAVGDSRNFGVGIGFGFEHNPANLDDRVSFGCDLFGASCAIHAFRMLAEVRLGWLSDQLFLYGFVSPGLGLIYADFGDGDTDPGFDVGLGGGAQYVVWKGLFVGGELGFDLGIYTNDEVDIGDDDFGVYLFDLKALVGYYF